MPKAFKDRVRGKAKQNKRLFIMFIFLCAGVGTFFFQGGLVKKDNQRAIGVGFDSIQSPGFNHQAVRRSIAFGPIKLPHNGRGLVVFPKSSPHL